MEWKKRYQETSDERIIYSSQEKKCLSFKPIDGFRKVVFRSREELLETIYLLVDGGYKVQ